MRFTWRFQIPSFILKKWEEFECSMCHFDPPTLLRVKKCGQKIDGFQNPLLKINGFLGPRNLCWQGHCISSSWFARRPILLGFWTHQLWHCIISNLYGLSWEYLIWRKKRVHTSKNWSIVKDSTILIPYPQNLAKIVTNNKQTNFSSGVCYFSPNDVIIQVDSNIALVQA